MKHLLLCLCLCLVSLPFLQAGSITVAQYLCRRLHEIGSNTIFGVTGDYSYLFLHAVEADANLTRVQNHNELEASYAAWGYTRASPTQSPGVVSVTYTAGGYTGLTGLVGANLDQVPIIYIAGAPPTSAWQLLENFQVSQHHVAVDQFAERDVFARFTSAQAVIQNAQRAPYQIDEVLLAALSFNRPVYMDVWTDVWLQLVPEPTSPLNPASIVPYAPNMTAVAASIAETVLRLQDAKFPCIYAGREIKNFGLQDVFEELVNTTNLPYFTNQAAKGIISEFNPHLVLNAPNNFISTSIDFLLEIGTVYADVDSRVMGFYAPNACVTFRARKGSVTTSYRILYNQVPLNLFLEGLLTALQNAHYVNPFYFPAQMHQTFPVATKDDPDSMLTYDSFVNHIKYSGIINENSVLAIDTTYLNGFVTNLIPVTRDGYISDNTLLTIGWTGGAGIGIKEALPEKRVITIVGDGAFQNLPMGLATSQELHHDTIVFLLHNNVYAIEQLIEDRTPYLNTSAPFFPENLLSSWNYTVLAQAYHATGYRCYTHADMTHAINKALANTDGTTLIEIMLPLRDYPH